MPARTAVSKELGELFSVLSNPHRIRIIEELRKGEVDVNGLQATMGISHSGVSQHLAVLRARRLVAERRDGRHVYYHLPQPKLADWILQGLGFLEGDLRNDAELRTAVAEARRMWANPPEGESAESDSEV